MIIIAILFIIFYFDNKFSCYWMVQSENQSYFLRSSYLAKLFREPLNYWNHNRTRETRTMLDNIAKRWVTTTLLLSYRSTLLWQPYKKRVHSILDKKQRYSVFSLLFFSGRTNAINYSTFLPIAYRWWDFFYFVIDMKKQCTVFKAKTIARWYVLIKLIVI